MEFAYHGRVQNPARENPGESQDDNSEQLQQSAHVPLSRACDACRAKKVRCDKGSPCSSCRSLKIPCRISPKENERRQRVLISQRYETKIGSIDDRLLGIEESLRQITKSLEAGSFQTSQLDSTTKAVNALRRANTKPLSVVSASPKSETGASYEGNTSFLAHSLYAKGLFDTLTTYTSSGRSPALRSAITSLQSTIKSHSDPSIGNDLSFSSEPLQKGFVISDMEMPPLQVVLRVMRHVSVEIPRFFLEFPLIALSDFIDMCRNLYFSITDSSTALFTIVNCGLSCIFLEYSSPTHPIYDLEFESYASLCLRNYELALDSFNLSIEPSLENCQALLLGAVHAADISKPVLCKRLVTTAAHMTQSLGYHRLPQAGTDAKDLQAKKLVFWSVYSLDKALSFRLGCTSVLQDSDISTPESDHPDNPLMLPWHMLYQLWIELARFQCRVFEELYTVKALSSSQTDRENRARNIAQELENWRQKYESISSGSLLLPEIFQINLDSSDVVYYGVLTIVYRAIQPPRDYYSNFSKECILAAHKALAVHQATANRFQNRAEMWQGYVNWTLLYSPFAPFMIVFCEAVATLSLNDLKCLSDFVSSIQPKQNTSKPAARLYQLCSAFYEVAKEYIEDSLGKGANLATSTPTEAGLLGQGISTPFNHGQVSMGTPDNRIVPPGDFAGIDEEIIWPIEDWFVPDQYMTGILDAGFRQ